MKESESKAFTGASLEKALKENSLTRSGTTVVGMVKKSEKGGHISFTRSGCDTWIDLPIDLIEQAEQLGQHRCKDHVHPVFKITLKEGKDPEAKLLASLLAQPYPETRPGFNPPPEMMTAAQTGAPFHTQASGSPEWGGPSPVGGMTGPTNLSRRRPGPGEYGCCRWDCIWWHYYECTGPDGRRTICARCQMYGCVEFGCEPGRDWLAAW